LNRAKQDEAKTPATAVLTSNQPKEDLSAVQAPAAKKTSMEIPGRQLLAEIFSHLFSPSQFNFSWKIHSAKDA